MNSQSENLPNQPIQLSIDVDQWRRDIHTFSEMTSHALQAIVFELSRQCTEVRSNSDVIHREQAEPTFSTHVADSGSTFGSNDTIHAVDQRLARLEQQLDQRISETVNSSR